MNINLHIEKLVLEGLPVGAQDGPLVQAAVQQELARLLGQSGLALRGSVPALRGETIRMAGGGAEQLGAQIAQAVHGGMEK